MSGYKHRLAVSAEDSIILFLMAFLSPVVMYSGRGYQLTVVPWLDNCSSSGSEDLGKLAAAESLMAESLSSASNEPPWCRN